MDLVTLTMFQATLSGFGLFMVSTTPGTCVLFPS